MALKPAFLRSNRIPQWLRSWWKPVGPTRSRKYSGHQFGLHSAQVLCLESRALLAAPTVTQSVATLAATATTLVINGTGFATVAANNSVVVKDTVTGKSITVTPTTASATSLTVPLTGIGTLTGGDHLTAVVTTSSVSSGAAVQVATIKPVVTASTAAVGSTLTIQGVGFDTTISNNKVTLSDNGHTVTGTITVASATSLTLTISGPRSAGPLTAVVTVNNVSSGAAVQVGTVQPSVTTNTAQLAPNASSIVITGIGFDPNHAQNTVVFSSGAVGIVTAWSDTSLTVTFLVKPKTAGPLTVVVTSRHISSGTPVQVATV